MKIVYVHGANATPKSFTFIKSQLGKHEAYDFTYDANDPVEGTVKHLAEFIPRDSHIISHSLGGVLAVAASQRVPDKIKSIVTISAPFGGSEAASRALLFMPFNTFLHNISVHSKLIQAVSSSIVGVPLLKVITTAGNYVFETKMNDGVVTVDSQMSLWGGEELVIHLNHFEVLMDQDVADSIKLFIKQHQK